MYIFTFIYTYICIYIHICIYISYIIILCAHRYFPTPGSQSTPPSQVSWGDRATDGDLGAMPSCKDDESLGWRPGGTRMAWRTYRSGGGNVPTTGWWGVWNMTGLWDDS